MVTGAASGLGRAIAFAFSRAGAHVLVADVDDAGAKDIANDIANDIADGGGNATALALDVTDPAMVNAAMLAAFAEHGPRFDCLVNNAGTDRGDDLVNVSDDRWHQVFAVNVDGPMHTSRGFVRGLLGQGERQRPADIVNIGSISALTVGSGAGAYNSSKAALLKFTEVMQTEARERGWPVRVSMIHPAAMRTPMMDQWGLPTERMMDPAIVASLVVNAVSLPPEVVLQSLVVTLRNEWFPR